MRLGSSRYYFALLIALVASVRPAAAGDATDLLRLGVQSIILQQQREENAARSRPPAQVQPTAPRRQTARPVRSQQVSEVQRLLNEMGYNAGPVDGQFGRKTRAAIKAFQRDQGLAPSGQPNRQLLEQLRYAQPRPFTQTPQTGGQVNSLAAFNVLNGFDLPFSDYRSGSTDPRLRGIALDTCASQCLIDPACRSFTYNQPMQVCILKSRQPRPSPFPGAISGLKTTTAESVTAGMRPPAGQDFTGLSAPPTAGHFDAGAQALIPADPVPLPVFVLEEPLRGLAPVQHGTRLLTGHPIMYGAQIGPDVQIDRRIHSKSSFDLAYLVDLMIARAQPDIFKRPDVALAYAERYLFGPRRKQFFAGCRVSCSRNLPYDGWAGSNEFERAEAYRAFLAQIVPELQNAAPPAPIGLLRLSEVEILPYDPEAGAFPIHPRRGAGGLFGYVRPAAEPTYQIDGDMPQSVAVAPHAAPAFLAQVQNEKRLAFLAAFQTLAKPEWDFNVNRPRLSVKNEGFALFTDAAMTNRLHVFSSAPIAPQQPAPEITTKTVQMPVTVPILIARFAPQLFAEEAMREAVLALISTDQGIYRRPSSKERPFFSREEVEGRVASFAVNDLLPGFRSRLSQRLAAIPNRMVATSAVSLGHLIYEDGALRRNMQNWGFAALDKPLRQANPAQQNQKAEGRPPVFTLPNKLLVQLPEESVPEELAPAFRRLKQSGQINLILDFLPVVPPLAMPADAAEALYKRPECVTDAKVFRQSGMTDDEAQAQVQACHSRRGRYKQELGIALDIEFSEAVRGSDAQPALVAKVLGARVTGPEGQLLRRFTREELGAAQAQLQAAQSEQAASANAAPTIDIAPTAALVHVGAKLMGENPLSVMEGIVGWRGDRNMNVFEKRDLAQRLVADSRDRSGDDSYWVGGNIVWESYDFSSERFPVKSLGLTVLAPLDDTLPRGVTLQAINAEKFALPMPPDVARSFTEQHGDRKQFAIRAKIAPRKAGSSSGALYLHSEVLSLEVLKDKVSAQFAQKQDILHRWPGEHTAQADDPMQAARRGEQTNVVSAPAPLEPAATDPALDLAGVTLGMDLTEAEAIVRSQIDVGVVTEAAEDAPYATFISFVSADASQQFVLFTDPVDGKKVVAVGRSIYVAAPGGKGALHASLIEKYGEPLAGSEGGAMVWTDAVNAPPHIHAPPALKYRLGGCQVAFGAPVGGNPSGAAGAAARKLSVYSGRGQAEDGSAAYDTEVWRKCAPILLAEVRSVGPGARLDYALLSLPDYAATWAAAEASKDGVAEVAIPKL